MRFQRFCVLFVTSLVLASCGSAPSKKPVQQQSGGDAGISDGGHTDGGNSGSNNGNNGSNNGNNGSNNGGAVCGNGVVEAGESCDSGIPTGEGSCPNACDDGLACTAEMVVGTAAACTAHCEVTAITACVNADGCCPDGCSFDNDDDCSETCGDGTIDPGETCDGNCPTSCDDGMACTTDSLVGSAANCSAECSHAAVTSCVSGDGCCPAGCTSLEDNDCQAVCGNGTVEMGETCDGNCPTSCDDGMACTSDVISGTAAQCNVACSHQQITACQTGDGCCPSGCTYANDMDCPCTPATCDGAGRQCGNPGDGCGGTLSCGGCPSGQTCSNFTCIGSGEVPVGAACSSDAQCGSDPGAFCAPNPNYYDGYCTKDCQYDNDCPSGSHCGLKDSSGQGDCVKNCTASTDCRSTGYACYNVDESQDNSTECGPSGTGSSPVGAACQSVATCDGGTEATCFLDSQGWPNGYCSVSCVPLLGAGCPMGSACEFTLSTTSWCRDECTSNADCRTGYTCQQITTDLSGGTAMVCLTP